MNLEKDAQTSWFRLLITVVLDWRLVLAVVLLIVVLLLKKPKPREAQTLPGSTSSLTYLFTLRQAKIC